MNQNLLKIEKLCIDLIKFKEPCDKNKQIIEIKDNFFNLEYEHIFTREANFYFNQVRSIGFNEVLSSQNFCLNAIILKQNSYMPIHDHPKMTGFLKGLFGEAQMNVYNIDEQDQIYQQSINYNFFYKQQINTQIIESQRQIININDQTKVEITKEQNLHDLQAITNMIFIDLLIPGYDYKERFCNFYEIQEQQKENKVKLLLYPGFPKDYETDSIQI